MKNSDINNTILKKSIIYINLLYLKKRFIYSLIDIKLDLIKKNNENIHKRKLYFI